MEGKCKNQVLYTKETMKSDEIAIVFIFLLEVGLMIFFLAWIIYRFIYNKKH